jgi:hypothetical protein
MTDNERLRKWLDAAVELAYRAGAEQERAAVVAWLEKAGWMPSLVEVFRRGEHRREEKP